MEEIIFIVTEAPEGGYTARALGESIFTERTTLRASRMRRDAISTRVRSPKLCDCISFEMTPSPSDEIAEGRDR